MVSSEYQSILEQNLQASDNWRKINKSPSGMMTTQSTESTKGWLQKKQVDIFEMAQVILQRSIFCFEWNKTVKPISTNLVALLLNYKQKKI